MDISQFFTFTNHSSPQFDSIQVQGSTNEKWHHQTTERELNLINCDVNRLFMIAEALWLLLKNEHGYTDEILVSKITEIDMRDGKLDGRDSSRLSNPSPIPCPACGRTMSMRRPLCIYCGFEIEVTVDPFDRGR